MNKIVRSPHPFLTACLIAVFYGAVTPAAAQETITVHAARKLGPATQRASGFLGGFHGETVLADAILLPLKPRLLRTKYQDVFITYGRCQAMNCAIEVLLHQGYSVLQQGYPGDHGTWEPWLRHVSQIANELNQRNMTNVSFCIWDNADRHESWPRPDSQFFETWQRTHATLRRLMPTAKLVGPSSTWGPNTDWWQDHQGDDTWYLRTFLAYCLRNQCLPDIVSRHDHYPDGSSIERDAAVLKDFFQRQNLKPIPFEEDDLGPRIVNNLFAPGIYVSFFASVERAAIARTAKCCWDHDYGNNMLDGLVTKDTRQPRALWWTYKAYADITGDLVYVTRSDSVDAVAGLESNGMTMRMLVGRFANRSQPVRVQILQFANESAPFQATAYKINNLQRAAMPKPDRTINLPVTTIGGAPSFTLNNLDD